MKTRRPQRESGGLLRRLLYYLLIVTVLGGAARIYFWWLDYYNTLHPEVIQAVAMGYVEELPLNGILVWDEQVVTIPREGVLTYPSSRPRRVAKGETIAAVDGQAIKVETAGYFFPALDDMEGSWVYSRLWPGISDFPVVHPARFVENGTYLRRGEPIGKLVPQPQDLRCIAYLDRTPALENDIKLGFIDVKTEPHGKNRRAEVRASLNAGQKIKVYVTLPFFEPDLLFSRNFSCSVVTGDSEGVLLPDTSVVLRDGRMGVLLVRGSVTKFTEIEGFPADEHNFFITKGILPGNLVVLHADRFKEGLVHLW
ncbi:MAG: hypothetical protein LBR61_10785 [Synergistaceae bacterium]|jgi:hypothetical protein|nr:hypothetical protein [Synergistaceae bacterium]